jgi:VCBS repeat-containing protein
LSIPAAGVLGNDSDPEGSALTAFVLTPPLHGAVSLNADGGFVYTPSQKFHGSDQFTYRAFDGELFSQPATVTIRVGSVNHAPVAVDDTLLAYENATLSLAAPGITSNDSDPDGDSLTVILVTPPAGGTLNLNPNGSLNYTPPQDFIGQMTFQYRVSDGVAQSNVATVRITVRQNSPPQAVDDFFNYCCGTLMVSAPGVLGNDTDADNDPITAQLVGQAQFGTVTLNPDGSFVYVPNDSEKFGSDQFTYRASDGHSLSNVATVTLGNCFSKSATVSCCFSCGK